MAKPSAADILRGSGDDAIKLKNVVGETFTVTDFEERHSRKFDSDFVLIDAINGEGEDVTLMGGGHLASKLRKLQRNELLPLEVKVVSFPTDKGDGYGLDVVED